MIILIAGASHTGKTVLAQKMLEKYKIPYFSIDHLKMGLIRSGNTKLTPEDDVELEEYLWPIIREMIKTAIENGQNLVIEGGYIPFNWKEDFDNEYLKEIRYYCLVMSETYINNNFNQIKNMPMPWKIVLMIRGVQKNPYSKKMHIILKCAKSMGVIIF